MGKLIKTDGTILEIEPKNKPCFSLKEMQGFVGGYIECVYLTDDKIMVVNEEGKLNGLPLNTVATKMYNNPHDIIVGNVIVLDAKEIN